MSSTRGWTLAAAAAMALGAAGLVPSVLRYWSARLGADAEQRATTARALKPAAPAPSDARLERRPPPAASAAPTPAPAPRALLAAGDEPEPEPATEAGGERVEEVDEAPPAEPAPSAPPGSVPAHAHAAEHAGRATAEPFEPSGLASSEEPAEAPAAAPEPAPLRHVSITVLEARTQPGLCKGSSDALEAREVLMARFPAVSWDDASLIHLDPRLAPSSYPSLVADLEQAEREMLRVLGLAPPRPEVFAYYDTQLLLAGGCTNEDVVAYYDGALHVVPSHEDVEQSVLHEYTHHALTSAGLLGPAWAQEGIAMHMAGETWWRGGWMARVLERPFSLEVMESAVPYTLRSDQAGSFYAQSAAMVACAIRGDPRGLRGLVESLAAGNDRGQLSYQLPSAAAPTAWRRCFSDLAR